MKITKYHLNFIFLIFIILFNGCTKDLDLSPRDTISDASFWKTASDFEKGANILYQVIPSFEMYDRDADIAYNYPNTVSNSTWTTPETDGNWNNAYTWIRRCNNVIERAAASSIADEVKVFVAEAKFFRAFNYWLLYRRYGGVPIVDKVLDVDSPELYLPRNTEKETIDFIFQDLKDAIPDLPQESQVSISRKGRITKGAANGLITRVALYEGSWRKFHNTGNANECFDMVIAAANELINSGEYALYYDKDEPEKSYVKLFDEYGNNSSECILVRRFEREVAPHVFPGYTQLDGFLPTKTLADMYLCTNGLPIDRNVLFQGYETFTSEFENRDPRMSQTMKIPGTLAYAILFDGLVEYWPFRPDRNYNTGYILFKYMCQNPDYQVFPYHEQQKSHYKSIRFGEILLNLAEAIFEKSDAISDADLEKTINQLRKRAGFPIPLTNAFVTANNLNMRNEIRRERTVELALEGFRRDDLRRWKTAETELVKSIRGVKIVGTDWGTKEILIDGSNINQYLQPEWQARTDAEGFIVCEAADRRNGFDPAKHYLYPLPIREISLNPNLTQNPRW
jgi:hypothetical protein